MDRLKGLILSGGQGRRLRPITHTSAKQLVPVANKPVLFYGIEAMAEAGIEEVGIIIAPETGDEIRAAAGDGSQFGVRLRFVEEPEPRGTAGALKYAEDLLDERFLMLNGDVLTDIDLAAQIEQHERTAATGTLASAIKMARSGLGDQRRPVGSFLFAGPSTTG